MEQIELTSPEQAETVSVVLAMRVAIQQGWISEDIFEAIMSEAERFKDKLKAGELIYTDNLFGPPVTGTKQ